VKTRFHCTGCGTTVTATSRKSAQLWPCLCGQQAYAAGVSLVEVPVLPVNPEHEALVDQLVAEAIRANRQT